MAISRRKRKARGQTGSPSFPHPAHVHHLLLAASARSPSSSSHEIIKLCLQSHLALITRRRLPPLPDLLPSSLLALLPSLLNSRDPKLASVSSEVVGAAALTSFEANERIVSDNAMVSGLVTALRNPNKRVVEAVTNAILDLSTTSIGRERLCEFSTAVKLMSIFCEGTTSLMTRDAPFRSEMENGTIFAARLIENKLLALVLDAVLILVNSCSVSHLEKIPKDLASSFLLYLRKFWVVLRDSQEGWSYSRHFKAPEVAEALFRLSMYHSYYKVCSCDEVKTSIFGGHEFCFQDFLLNYWEDSPVLLRQEANVSLYNDVNDIVYLLAGCFRNKNIDSILECILGGLVSCPPVVSDELDILVFLNEIKGRLGVPIMYGQDIRVVKTIELTYGPANERMKSEVNYVSECINPADLSIRKLKEAYEKGYTIALRGMEFRFQKVASVANGLAKLFGQPAVGANLYLTPPGSQGLTCHYDDHCVFICQLVGNKKWTTYPGRKVLLPRLYDPLDSIVSLEDVDFRIDCKEFLLKEGDVLYIPRGCPHEAHTIPCGNDSLEFSLHLTFGIEVEPPFEWEGFAHVALHCWNYNLRPTTSQSTEFMSVVSDAVLVNLLHASIKLIADTNPCFRRACMVAQHTSDYSQNQREIFSYVINTVNSDANFDEAFTNILTAVNENNEESLQWMRWLRHLHQEGEADGVDLNNPLKVFDKITMICDECILEVATAFWQMKSAFCRDVMYTDVCKSFKKLLLKYTNSREQYMAGMLALHSK